MLSGREDPGRRQDSERYAHGRDTHDRPREPLRYSLPTLRLVEGRPPGNAHREIRRSLARASPTDGCAHALRRRYGRDPNRTAHARTVFRVREIIDRAFRSSFDREREPRAFAERHPIGEAHALVR